MRGFRLKRPALALLALACLGLPGPGGASIPPYYKVTLVADTREEEALNRALLELMHAHDAFQWVAGDVHRGDLAPCLDLSDPEGCIREKLAATELDSRSPPVVVRAWRLEGDRFRWLCVGAQTKQVDRAQRDAVVDLPAALFGGEDALVENRRAAMRCIYAAASEAS